MVKYSSISLCWVVYNLWYGANAIKSCLHPNLVSNIQDVFGIIQIIINFNQFSWTIHFYAALSHYPKNFSFPCDAHSVIYWHQNEIMLNHHLFISILSLSILMSSSVSILSYAETFKGDHSLVISKDFQCFEKFSEMPLVP